MDLKPFVGASVGPFFEDTSKCRIDAFKAAIGSTDPGVPPTFPTVFRTGEFELCDRMGVKLHQVLHAEQEYEYFGEIHVGDKLSCVSRVAEVIAKRGSASSLQFIHFETEVSCEGSKVSVSRTTLVLKGTI